MTTDMTGIIGRYNELYNRTSALKYHQGKQATMQFVVDRLTAYMKTHPETMGSTPQPLRSFLASLMTDTLAFVMDASNTPTP